MMILPIASALENCLQNLTSRIAGVDNEQMTNRVMMMGSMLGYSVGAMKEQFKTPTSKETGTTMSGNSNNTENSISGLKGFVNRAKSVINPSMNLSAEKDYNGDVNPIRDNIRVTKETMNTKNGSEKINNLQNPNAKIKSVARWGGKSWLCSNKGILTGWCQYGRRKFQYK